MASNITGELVSYFKEFKGEWDIEDLLAATSISYPLVNKFLQLLALSPTSNAGNERIFSMLRRVKNYMRCSMKEERLNGIMIANANQDIVVEEKMLFE